MNPATILALIGDLYSQIITLQTRVAELETPAPPSTNARENDVNTEPA